MLVAKAFSEQAASSKSIRRTEAYSGDDGIPRVGEAAKMPFPIHPHMLRHACGFKLANDGHDTRALQQYLGHKNIQHTVRYTDMAPDRFKDFWRD